MSSSFIKHIIGGKQGCKFQIYHISLCAVALAALHSRLYPVGFIFSEQDKSPACRVPSLVCISSRGIMVSVTQQ